MILKRGTTMAEEKKTEQPEMSKEEQIGFHKGSISVLSKEREEMIKIASITEQLMQMHMKALGELGVDLEKLQEEVKPAQGKDRPQKRVPIENLI